MADLDAALSRQLDSRVVVSAAQQVLDHHAVHALLLPQIDRGRLVAAVLLQMLDPPFAKLSALILCLNGLGGLKKKTLDREAVFIQWEVTPF